VTEERESGTRTFAIDAVRTAEPRGNGALQVVERHKDGHTETLEVAPGVGTTRAGTMERVGDIAASPRAGARPADWRP
jgi:hypothetical protein